jgi:hypothetical protein
MINGNEKKESRENFIPHRSIQGEWTILWLQKTTEKF